jgi:hypothetical protein
VYEFYLYNDIYNKINCQKNYTMILTEQDIERALNQDYQNTLNELVESTDLLLKGNRMLVENRLSEQEYQVLQEGLWEKVKYGLAKLGRYKAGGKIFGKGKIDQEAGAKIQSILDKKGNEVIKKLNDIIKQENPEFPNNKEGEKFLKTVIEIATVYDSIIEATKKNPKEEGYLPTDAANSIIADLAEYVKKFLDVDLASAYTVMDSEEEKDGKEDKELLADEVEDINEDEAADVRAKLQAKKGGKEYDTKRMGKEGLKSNKLPMTLAGVGASLGAFSWLVNTQWFRSLFETVTQNPSIEYIKQTVETKSDIFGSIKPGQGMTQLMNEMNGLGLSPKSSPEDFLAGVKQLGGGNLQDGINALAQDGGIFKDPNAAKEVLTEIAKNPHGHGDSLGEIFQDKWAGTGKSMGDALVTVQGGTLKGLIVKTIVTAVPKIIMKTTVKVGAGYAIAKGFGAVLGPIGIGLVAAGALVKLMRVKGQKQSRAKTLNDLLQSLQPIEAGESTLPPVLPDPKPNPVGGGEGGGKVNKETLFNDLAGFFKFTYNNRKMASPDVFGDKEESSNPCSKFTKGQKVKTKTGKTVEVIANSIEDSTIEKGQIKVKREDGGTYAVRCTQLSESMINKGKLINEMSNNNLISEGKFIKDPEVIKILKQKSGIDQNKLKFFEGFMTRVEIIRNKVKKMDNTGDNVIDKYIQKLKANPIMKTDFTNTFNVNPKKPESVEKMGKFINSFIEVIYKGNFRGKTFKDAGGMVNKMGTLGGGNINKPMGESYIVEEDNVERKPGLKQNTIQFIVDVMGLFQYMYKLKKEGKLGGKSDTKTVEKKAPGSSKEKKPTEKPEVKQESIQKPENKFLKEEVKRILTLMNKI